MGHERIGSLPRTKCWHAIVEDISRSDGLDDKVAELADKTLYNVRTRFRKLHTDSGIQAAFGYLVSLATSALPRSTGYASPEVRLEENPSSARIVKDLSNWVDRHVGSTEYATIATRAAADTIAGWTKTRTAQGVLFSGPRSASEIWSEAASAEGFCQVARSFFAHFTRRYLRYFLERAASAQLGSVETREKFDRSLHHHIEDISIHAFQTSKIAQSFAAGWFNKHARESRPTDKELRNFLGIAFGKLQEEMQREAGA